MKQPLGIFNTDHFMIILEPVKGYEEMYFNLRFHGIEDTIFQFRAKNKELGLQWQRDLKGCIVNSEGYKNQRSALGIR